MKPLRLLLAALAALPAASGPVPDELDELARDYPEFAKAFEAELRRDPAKLRTIETYRKHEAAIAAFDPARPETLDPAAAALRELYAPGEKGNFENVQWILQKSSIITPEQSEKIAAVRNVMVDGALREMAVMLGEVCKVDFSPARHAMNDIDQTFRVLEGRRIPGTVQKQIFEHLFLEKWRIPAPKMDVVSHPEEQRVPDWRKTGSTRSDFVVQLKKGSALLKKNPEAYFLEGAYRMQVERRAFDADARLVAIYTYNPRTQQHGPALEAHHVPRPPPAAGVAVDALKVDEFVYRLRRPEARASYAWGASVGNWYFYHHHGEGVRFASKYGLRSFAESVGWRVQLENPALLPGPAPKTYEELQDDTLRKEIFDQVYERFYADGPDRRGLGIPREELRLSLATAKGIRDAKDKYGAMRPEILEPLAKSLAGGAGAFDADPARWFAQAEARVEEHVKRMMLFNIEASLPGRAQDWLHPKVDPRQLGFTEEQIRGNAPELQKEIKAAERRLARAALFELVLALNALPPEIRSDTLARVRAQHAGDGVLVYALDKLHELSSKDIDGWLKAEAARSETKRRSAPLGKDLGLVLDQPAEEADARAARAEKIVIEDAGKVLEELRKAGLSDADGFDLTALPNRPIPLPPGSPERARALQQARWAKLLAAEARLQASTPGRLLTRPLGDWRLIEQLDFTQGLVPRPDRERILNQVLDWGNADSVVNVLRAFYEYRKNPDAPGAGKALLGAIAWESASAVLPVVGVGIAILSAANGDLAPGLLMGVGIAIPQLGMAMMAYNVATNAWDFSVAVGTDVQVDSHYQGRIPDRAGAPPRESFGFATLPEGILMPVFESLKRARLEKLEKLRQTADPDARRELEAELAGSLTEDVRGTRRHVYAHFRADLDRRRPAATPEEEWHAVLLAGGDRVEGRENDFGNLPRRLLVYFGRPVDDYLAARGPYAGLQAALGHPVLAQNYLCSDDGMHTQSRQNLRDGLVGALVIAYRDVLRAKVQGGAVGPPPAKLALPSGYEERRSGALIRACLEGRPGAQLLDRTLQGGRIHAGDVPDLPSVLHPVPGATYEEKLRNFFAHFDGELTRRLKQQQERGLPVPPEEAWDRWKLGMDDAEAAAADEKAGHLKYTPILAYFREVVKEYRQKHPANLPAAVSEEELQTKLAENLTLDYKAGLLDARRRALEDQQRRAAERTLQFHARADRLLKVLAGAETPEARKQRFEELARHSGDPFAAAEGLDEFVRAIVAADAPGAEVKIVPPPDGLVPGRPLVLQAEVLASRHFHRPFTFEWSLAGAGNASSALDLSARVKGVVLRLGPDAPQGGLTASVLVKDANGIEVGRAEQPLGRRAVGTLEAAATIRGDRISVDLRLRDWFDPELFKGSAKVLEARWDPAQRKSVPTQMTLLLARFDVAGGTQYAHLRLPAAPKEAEAKEIKLWAGVYLDRPGTYPCKLTLYSGPQGAPQWTKTFEIACGPQDRRPLTDPERQYYQNRTPYLQGIVDEQLRNYARTKHPGNLVAAWQALGGRHTHENEQHGLPYLFEHRARQEEAEDDLLRPLGGNLVLPSWAYPVLEPPGSFSRLSDFATRGDSLLNYRVDRAISAGDLAGAERWLDRMEASLGFPDGRKEEKVAPGQILIGPAGLPPAIRGAYSRLLNYYAWQFRRPEQAARLLQRAERSGVFTAQGLDSLRNSYLVYPEADLKRYPPEAFTR